MLNQAESAMHQAGLELLCRSLPESPSYFTSALFNDFSFRARTKPGLNVARRRCLQSR